MALTFGPLLGFAAMLAAWSILDTELAGDLDVGTVLIGAAVSGASVLAYGAVRQLPRRTTMTWSVYSFGFTFAIGLALVLLFVIWLNNLNFGLD